jgi:hypothetical protein
MKSQKMTRTEKEYVLDTVSNELYRIMRESGIKEWVKGEIRGLLFRIDEKRITKATVERYVHSIRWLKKEAYEINEYETVKEAHKIGLFLCDRFNLAYSGIVIE